MVSYLSVFHFVLPPTVCLVWQSHQYQEVNYSGIGSILNLPHPSTSISQGWLHIPVSPTYIYAITVTYFRGDTGNNRLYRISTSPDLEAADYNKEK